MIKDNPGIARIVKKTCGIYSIYSFAREFNKSKFHTCNSTITERVLNKYIYIYICRC